MQEYHDPYDYAWAMAESANASFDVVQQAEAGSTEHAEAMAELTLLRDMAALAMFAKDSPFARPGITPEEIEAQRHPAETVRESLLRSSIESLIQDYSTEINVSPGVHSRMLNCFYREGIATLRDVLVIGLAEVKDLRNFGGESVKVMRHIITATKIGITWQKQPSVADIAQFCNSFDQITSRRFGEDFSANGHIRNLAELLEHGEDGLARFLATKFDYSQGKKDPAVEAARIMGRARTFAEAFTLARQSGTGNTVNEE